MGQRELAPAHGIVGLATGDHAPDRGFDGHPVAVCDTEFAEVVKSGNGPVGFQAVVPGKPV